MAIGLQVLMGQVRTLRAGLNTVDLGRPGSILACPPMLGDAMHSREEVEFQARDPDRAFGELSEFVFSWA